MHRHWPIEQQRTIRKFDLVIEFPAIVDVHSDLPDEISSIDILLMANGNQITEHRNHAATKNDCSQDKRPGKFAEAGMVALLFQVRPSERNKKYKGAQRRRRQGSNLIVEAGYIRCRDAGKIGWRQQKRKNKNTKAGGQKDTQAKIPTLGVDHVPSIAAL